MSMPLFLRRAWRELLEHFLHALIEILDVLVGFVGERIACGASPDQLLSLGIEEIDDHCAHLVCFSRGGSVSKTSAAEPSPTPAASKPVIEGIQSLLVARHFDGYDGNIAAGIHLGPAFCCQGGVDGTLDPIDIQSIFRFDLLP